MSLFVTVPLSVLLVSCLAYLLVSCVTYGPPEDKRASKMSKLHGGNYNSSAQVMGVSLLERAGREVLFQGRVVYGNDLTRIPLKNVGLVLKEKAKVIASGSTNDDGEFQVKAAVPNGDYELEIRSSSFRGKTKVSVTKLEIKNLLIVAEPIGYPN